MARKPDVIVATSHDFAILGAERPTASALWEDVRRIRAYKNDEFVTDLICLDVELRDGTTWLLHEETPGWDDFLAAAEGALGGMRPFQSWFPEVSRPPFDRSEQVIFERGAREA